MDDSKGLGEFRRINVIGTSGSGKSRFGREMAAILALPYYEMDEVFWKPHWQQSSDEEFIPRIREITSREAWVLDGNYTRTTPEKWRCVQLVVWLDLGFLRTVTRVTRRAVRRAFTGEELWTGTENRESLAKAFLSRDSIIWWAITTYRPNRRKYSAMMGSPDYPHIRFVRLKSPAEVSSFLASLRQSVGRSGRADRVEA